MNYAAADLITMHPEGNKTDYISHTVLSTPLLVFTAAAEKSFARGYIVLYQIPQLGNGVALRIRGLASHIARCTWL